MALLVYTAPAVSLRTRRFGGLTIAVASAITRQRTILLLAATLLIAALASAAAAPDLFDDLYRRGQERNGSLETFTAAFTEVTTSTLLTRPLTARGTLAVERPARIALRYTDPDIRAVLIDGNRMTVSWPSRNVHQTRDIGAAQKRVQKYFVDSSPRELRSHFRIDARDAGDRPEYLVTMVPLRKQIKEGLAKLELWIDPVSLLMTGMRMAFPNGDTKTMTFTDVKTNVALDPSWFRTPAPATK